MKLLVCTGIYLCTTVTHTQFNVSFTEIVVNIEAIIKLGLRVHKMQRGRSQTPTCCHVLPSYVCEHRNFQWCCHLMFVNTKISNVCSSWWILYAVTWQHNQYLFQKSLPCLKMAVKNLDIFWECFMCGNSELSPWKFYIGSQWVFMIFPLSETGVFCLE